MGLEGFVEWVDSTASDPDEEREDDMSSLAIRFSVRMRKWAASSQGRLPPALKHLEESALDGLVLRKRLRRVRR